MCDGVQQESFGLGCEDADGAFDLSAIGEALFVFSFPKAKIDGFYALSAKTLGHCGQQKCSDRVVSKLGVVSIVVAHEHAVGERAQPKGARVSIDGENVDAKPLLLGAEPKPAAHLQSVMKTDPQSPLICVLGDLLHGGDDALRLIPLAIGADLNLVAKFR